MAADPMLASTSQNFKLTGSSPGRLDPSQTHRLLRFPNSTLLFASFHPHAASSLHGIDVNSTDSLYTAKRVVIEVTPTNENHWRFVPKALKDHGVENEGFWPRTIDLCGQIVEISEDQWDIYKLDPLYECRVCVPPALSRITRVAVELAQTPSFVDLPNGKRRMTEPRSSPPMQPRKRFHAAPEDETDEKEVASMVIDESEPETFGASSKRQKTEHKRQGRRDQTARRVDDIGQMFGQQGSKGHSKQRSEPPPDMMGKRKASSLFDPALASYQEEEVLRDAVNETDQRYKRTRTTSPGAVKRDLEARRLEREKQKRQRRKSELTGRQQQWHAQFMNEVYAEASTVHASPPEPTYPEYNPNESPSDIPRPTASPEPHYRATPSPEGPYREPTIHGDDSDDDMAQASNDESDEEETEAQRQAAIAESRRKLAELEADKPLWAEAARQRTAREKAEEEARRMKMEERVRAEARAEAARQEAQARRARQETLEREDAARRQREESVRLERERRQRQQRWSYGVWTVQRALERYKVLSETFDAARFSEDYPVEFEMIPWPILTSPMHMSVEDVDWAAVEKFFRAVQPHMRAQDFKTFMEKSHRRFHPDRWRSRRILSGVRDEAERGCLEVAANTVSQAVTPLWRELTSR
ncbi:hypothetical protein C8J56DRAFT_340929 [Mycena floridula]|nr:hypothetical protein C8J56DRAFT_340929 [Mycena floridula]